MKMVNWKKGQRKNEIDEDCTHRKYKEIGSGTNGIVPVDRLNW